MPRWVMHSTNSRTRATHCVIPNKDLLLVLMIEKKGRKSQFSCWIKSNILVSRSPTPHDQHEKTAGNQIPSQSIPSPAVYTCRRVQYWSTLREWLYLRDVRIWPLLCWRLTGLHNTALGSHLLNSVQQLEKLPPSTYLLGQVTVAAF